MISKFTSFLFVSFLGVLSLSAQNIETGFADYYADYLHGRETALGEIYDQSKFTCAHKTHPLGTLLRVTRLDNNLSVIVRVNDRGPYAPGRIVELSKAAAEKVRLLRDGIAEVRVEVVNSRGIAGADAPTSYEYSGAKGAAPESYDTPSLGNTTANRGVTVTLTEKTPFLPNFYTSSTTKPIDAPSLPRSSAKSAAPPPADRPASYDEPTARQDLTPKGLDLTQPRFYIQVGAYSDFANAERKHSLLKGRGISNIKLIEAEKGDGGKVYRAWVGPYPTESAANSRMSELATKYDLRGIVLRED